jgi:hypothetical protein
MAKTLFQRQSLDEIITIPDDIISVYVVENHIWRDGGSQTARQNRQAEMPHRRRVSHRPGALLSQRHLPPDGRPLRNPARRDSPIGQGIGFRLNLAPANPTCFPSLARWRWGMKPPGRLCARKSAKRARGGAKACTLLRERAGAKKPGRQGPLCRRENVGGAGRRRGGHERQRQIAHRICAGRRRRTVLSGNGARPAPLPGGNFDSALPHGGDLERYRRDLGKFLQDPAYFDEEEREELTDFLADLQNPDPGTQRDCGERLWRFYEEYLQTRPKIPMESEDILKHMVQRLLD